MKTIDVSQSRNMIQSIRCNLAGMIAGLGISIQRGVSLGFVLFLALSTLSLLNLGADKLEASFKDVFVVTKTKASNPVVASRSVNVRPVVIYQKPQVQMIATENRVPPRDVSKTIRESGYLLNAIESFTRSLGRFAQ